MIKELLHTTKRLYSSKIIVIYFLLFLVIQPPALQVIPDYLNLAAIKSPGDYQKSLLSIIIGFSGIILTIFLVMYNTIAKKLRRYSFDFIFDNPWIRIIFSIFSGSIIFVALNLLFINKMNSNAVVTSIYLSSVISFLSLVIQFPLVVTALKFSNSYQQIRQLLHNVSDNDVLQIIRPERNNNFTIETLERNKLILLKDIGVFAIKDNDWGVPQTIINGLYKKLIEPLEESTSEFTISNNSSAFCFVLNHFKNIAISETDYITVRVTLTALYSTHFHFAKNKIRHLRNNTVDEVLKDMFRRLIEDNSFFQLQPYILRKTSLIVREHINSLEYSDEELPTRDYRFSMLNENLENKNDVLTNYWFYLKNELPDLFFDPLNLSLKSKSQNVYDYPSIHIQGLFSDITSSKLTDSQKNELFEQYSYKAREAQSIAIRNEIYENIDIYSNTQIEIWLTHKRKYAWSALFELSGLVERLNKKNLGTLYLDDLFFIARSMSHKNIDSDLKTEVIQFIIEKGFKLFEVDTNNDFTKTEIIKQLKWLESTLKGVKDLASLREMYLDRIESLS